MSFHHYFADPRWRRERLFLCVVFPLVVLLLVGIVVAFVDKERRFAESLKAAQALEQAAQPVPAAHQTPRPKETSYESKGAAALAAGDLASARVLLQEALAEPGSKEGVYYQLGQLELESGHAEAAVRNFSVSLGLEARQPLAYLGRSEALRRLNRTTEALSDLHAAQTLEPANPVFSNKLFLARLEAGEKEAVQRDLQTARDLDTRALEPSWLGGAAGLAVQNGRVDEAAEILALLRTRVSPQTFRLILSDRVFDPVRTHKAFSLFSPPTL